MTKGKDIIVFDLETTGTSITKDRVIQLAALKIDHNFNILEPLKEILINPQMPIATDAIAAHGITDEMVKDKPPFISFSKSLFSFFQGCDLSGFNHIRFDIPLLSEEFSRCGIDWPGEDTKFIDCYKIYTLKEKRDLASAVKFYTGKELEGAHKAGNDVMGTLEVLQGQMGMYEDLQALDNNGLELFCLEGKRRVDLDGKLIYGPDGSIVYGFGKDIGKSVKQNPGFGLWMLDPKQDFSSSTKKAVSNIINGKKLF